MPKIIAITGISTSGKTTLARELQTLTGADVISLDWFFKRKRPKCRFESLDNGTLYERSDTDAPDSFRWNSLIQKIAASSSDWVIVEGSMVFACPLSDITDQTEAIINFSYDSSDLPVAINRLMARLNERGNDFVKSHFIHIVWDRGFAHPEYQIMTGWNKPMLRLKATENFATNFSLAADFVKQLQSKCI